MSEKFVKGGTDESKLKPASGKRKSRTTLNDRQKEALYRQYLMGEKVADLAAAYNIGVGTAYTHIANMRKKEVKMAFTQKVIAGNSRDGRLVYVNNAGNKFEGTHVTSDGKTHRWKFSAKTTSIARQMWDKWCNDLDDEQRFMDMVERKPEPLDEGKAVCGFPSDPIEEIRPIQDVNAPSDDAIRKAIHGAQEEFDAITTKHMEATGVALADTSEPAYLIWAKKPEPRCYGLYLTMEAAISEVDKLNEVAAFLGGEGAFEVEEVAWKG